MTPTLLACYLIIGFCVMFVYLLYVRRVMKEKVTEDISWFAFAIWCVWPIVVFGVAVVALVSLIQMLGNKL